MFRNGLFRGLEVLICAFALSACGGGSGTEASGNEFGAVLYPQLTAPDVVEGHSTDITLEFGLTYDGPEEAFLAYELDERLFVDAADVSTQIGWAIKTTLRADLAPGEYNTHLVLHACLNEDCSKEAAEPVRLPFAVTVKPNVSVQRKVELTRAGADPAPRVVLPVVTPAAAGALTLQAFTGSAMSATYDGSSLTIEASQVRAGTYAAQIVLSSTADPRYTRTVDVEYTVLAPAGGEVPLSVSGEHGSLTLLQGSNGIYRIQVTRPTWTTDWQPPTVTGDAADRFQLIDRGDGAYDVSFSGFQVPLGAYRAAVNFSAGPTGGALTVPFEVLVESGFALEGSLTAQFSLASPTSALTRSWRIVHTGSPAQWTAVSKSPGLVIRRASGRTGLDDVEVSIDPFVLENSEQIRFLDMEISLDRPGVSPQTFGLEIENRIPRIHRVLSGALVGTRGQVFLAGALLNDPSLLSDARWKVEGATVLRTLQRANGTLQIDLDDLVPGRPVSFTVDSALAPSQATVPVRAPLEASVYHQTLPYGQRRPGEYSPGLNAFYFAERDVAYRWVPVAGGWTLSHAPVPGLIDVAPAPDRSGLKVLHRDGLLTLDSTTLGVQDSLMHFSGVPQRVAIDENPLPAARALAFASDGRLLSTFRSTAYPQERSFGSLCSGAATVHGTPGPLEVCSFGPWKTVSHETTGWGIVRSVNGESLMGVAADGAMMLYSPPDAWLGGIDWGSPVHVAAVADGYQQTISNGLLIDPGSLRSASLASKVPATHRAGGYGLTSDGRFALVYGYRITGTGNDARATDPVVWVFPSAAANTATPTAIPLPSAVGCTTVPVAGEPCEHLASITVAAGDRTAFVLGPRGVVVLPLPAETTGQPHSTAQGRRLAKPPAPGLRRLVKNPAQATR